MYVTRPHTSLRLLVPNKSLHLHHCTATIWVTLYVIWHPLYKPDRYLPIHSTMTSFAFRTRKCVEYTVMCLVIWIGLQTVFRAMYTGTFFLLQCDIITGVSSVEEKPLPTLFFRLTHPASKAQQRTNRYTVVAEARLITRQRQLYGSNGNNSLANLSRLQYFQVGTLRTVAALRSLGHDACRPTTSTPKANPKTLLPLCIHSTSPLPTFHPRFYLRYPQKHTCGCDGDWSKAFTDNFRLSY
jgi:hypothetical protein